jgi:DNA-binding FadR family transcriptional regulator
VSSRQASEDAVKVRTLPVQVAERLTRRIVTGEFDAGHAPSEQEICTEFGVSRVVARETIKILASLDIVDVAQGRRVVVRPRDEWDYLSPQLIEWLPEDLVEELLRELHGMRMLLEPELAAMAAEVISEQTLARLRDALDRMATLESEPDRYLEVDQEFHMEICRAANNRILDRIMYSARWLGTASRRITNEDPAGRKRATADHARIHAALEAGDPAAARAAMQFHLRANYSALTGQDHEEVRAPR